MFLIFRDKSRRYDYKFFERALELHEETAAHRRWLHRNAEVGLHMPKAQAYVIELVYCIIDI